MRREGLEGAVVGLDYVQLFALADAMQVSKTVLARLLPSCELGMLDAIDAEHAAG